MQTVSQTDTRRRFSLKAFSFWAAFFSRAAFLIWINLDYFPLICINFNYMRLGEIKFSAFMENFGFAKKFFREISWFFLLRLDFFTFFAVSLADEVGCESFLGLKFTEKNYTHHTSRNTHHTSRNPQNTLRKITKSHPIHSLTQNCGSCTFLLIGWGKMMWQFANWKRG